MKVGVIADSHDRLPTLARAVALFKRMKVGAVFHAGDFVAPFAAKLINTDALGSIPLHCCYGNNDGERKGLKNILPGVVDGAITVKIDGKTIVMNHFIDWLTPGEIAPADIVITGHTHEVVNTKRDGKLFLNPGECCGWLHDRCTVAILDVANATAEIIDIHE